MRQSTISLRVRLLALIVVPLILISIIAGTWRYNNAKATAVDIFDRNLLAVTLAVGRDVAISGGDAISNATHALLEDVSGGRVFYHVKGPDGSFVSGYAYPPHYTDVPPVDIGTPLLFDGFHQDNVVRVSRLTEFTQMDGVSGFSTISVWQRTDQREAFARRLALKAVGIIVALVLTVFAVVWFGVRIGLRPLDDLEAAISIRHAEELDAIQRPVPIEVAKVVGTLNSLFQQVQASIASRDRFISDAAHQLRNPIAGIRALAESAKTARSGDEAIRRASRISEAAEHASRLSEQLLTLERLRSHSDQSGFETVNLTAIAKDAGIRNASKVLDAGIDIEFEGSADPLLVSVNPLLLGEAIENLVDNSLVHGGPEMSAIKISTKKRQGQAVVAVFDDGEGISEEHRDHVFERFTQLNHGQGTGLGLAIVAEIAKQHGGFVGVETCDHAIGTLISISLPLKR